MQVLKVLIFHFYTRIRSKNIASSTAMACSPLFHDDIPATWGTAECLIFTPAVLRAPGPTLSLTTPVEAVYSPGTYFTLGDNKSRWTTLLEHAELNRIERKRYTLGTSWSRASLYERGLLLFWRAGEARTKCGTWWQYDGNIDATGSFPVDLWYRMTYSWCRVTDCFDRNHEEVSGRINLR